MYVRKLTWLRQSRPRGSRARSGSFAQCLGPQHRPGCRRLAGGLSDDWVAPVIGRERAVQRVVAERVKGVRSGGARRGGRGGRRDTAKAAARAAPPAAHLCPSRHGRGVGRAAGCERQPAERGRALGRRDDLILRGRPLRRPLCRGRCSCWRGPVLGHWGGTAGVPGDHRVSFGNDGRRGGGRGAGGARQPCLGGTGCSLGPEPGDLWRCLLRQRLLLLCRLLLRLCVGPLRDSWQLALVRRLLLRLLILLHLRGRLLRRRLSLQVRSIQRCPSRWRRRWRLERRYRRLLLLLLFPGAHGLLSSGRGWRHRRSSRRALLQACKGALRCRGSHGNGFGAAVTGPGRDDSRGGRRHGRQRLRERVELLGVAGRPRYWRRRRRPRWQVKRWVRKPARPGDNNIRAVKVVYDTLFSLSNVRIAQLLAQATISV